ncbi:MAG: radical SAM family heme chaperone HemW [Anaerolineae bacterium]|nr:radical SAM family heme chaperone HemW [Anaerolineae bacterium]
MGYPTPPEDKVVSRKARLAMPTPSLSLYLHIPFCAHRCSYCDFNTYTSLDDLKEPYARALADEIRQVAGDERRAAHTIFFGGGTPSLMSAESLGQILDAVADCFDLAPDAEISMEANPGTVDAEYLAAVRALGVNRLSFGVQSVISAELMLLERRHDFQTVVNAITMARAAGFDNFNVDLIYGVPGQTLATWQQSLEAVLALNPPHVSLYCLTIEPGTPMQRWLNSGQIEPPDPDLAAEQYEMACIAMADAGLVHYEISNWALPGRECKHNLSYWRNNEYLGLGAGAHGHAAGYRYWVVKQPRVYIRRIAEQQGHYPWSGALADKIQLSAEDQIGDTMITQLRLLQEGVSLTDFATRFGRTPYDVYGPTLAQLIDWGLLTESGGNLLLTERGWFLSNQVFHRLV